MADLTVAERSAVESIVAGVQRRSIARRRAARSGWAFLATAAVALPVIASAMSNAITLTTALTRIGVALILALFVSSALGSLLETYQTQAALSSMEAAIVTARAAVATATADAAKTSTTTASGPDNDPEAVTGAHDDDK